MKKLVMLAGFAGVLLAGGCGTSSSPGGEVVGSGSERFAGETLTDWKSYGDHLAVFSVASEEEVPLTAEEEARGEGMVGRRATLRIDEVLWSAPDAPALPREVVSIAAGWVVHDRVRRPFRIESSPRLEVGERFIAPLVRVEWPSVEWGPLTLGAQLRIEDGRVSVRDGESHSGLQVTLSGKTPQQVGEALEQAEADPLAIKYRDLRPEKRIQAVFKERQG